MPFCSPFLESVVLNVLSNMTLFFISQVNKDLKQVFAFAIGGGSFYEYETIKVVVEDVENAKGAGT